MEVLNFVVYGRNSIKGFIEEPLMTANTPRNEVIKKRNHISYLAKRNYKNMIKIIISNAIAEQGWKKDSTSPICIVATQYCKRTKSNNKLTLARGEILPAILPAIYKIDNYVFACCKGLAFEGYAQVVSLQITKDYSDEEYLDVHIYKVSNRGDIEDAFKKGIQTSKELESE